MKTKIALINFLLILGITGYLFAQGMENLGLEGQRINAMSSCILSTDVKEVYDLIVGTDNGVYSKKYESNAEYDWQYLDLKTKVNAIVTLPYWDGSAPQSTNSVNNYAIFATGTSGIVYTIREAEKPIEWKKLDLATEIFALVVEINPCIIGTTNYLVFGISTHQIYIYSVSAEKVESIGKLDFPFDRSQYATTIVYKGVASITKDFLVYDVFVGTNNGVYSGKLSIGKNWAKGNFLSIGLEGKKITTMKINPATSEKLCPTQILVVGTATGEVYTRIGQAKDAKWITLVTTNGTILKSQISALAMNFNSTVYMPNAFDFYISTEKMGAYYSLVSLYGDKIYADWKFLGLKDKEILSTEIIPTSSAKVVFGTVSGIYQYSPGGEQVHIKITTFSISEKPSIAILLPSVFECEAEVDHPYRHPYEFKWNAYEIGNSSNDIGKEDIGGFDDSTSLKTIWKPMNNSGIPKLYLVVGTAKCTDSYSDVRKEIVVVKPTYPNLKISLAIEQTTKGYQFILTVSNIGKEIIEIQNWQNPLFRVIDDKNNVVYEIFKSPNLLPINLTPVGTDTTIIIQPNESKIYKELWEKNIPSTGIYTITASIPHPSDAKIEIFCNALLTITPVAIDDELIVGRTALGQSYPNPFNPECYIPYTISKTLDIRHRTVKIRIYNILGQLVKELDLGEKLAESYVTKDKAAYWNGRDSKGKEVVSGVYYYELVVNGKVVGVKKSLVVK